MAYAATVLDEFRLSYEQSGLDANEHRLSNYGAVATFMKDTPNLIPGWAALVEGRKSAARTSSIPVLKKVDFATSSSRACTAKTAQGTSAYVTPSWVTVETGFMMVPSEHEGNHLSYQAAFNNNMKHVQRVLLAAIDTAAVASLETNKSTVNNADGNPYTVTANAMVVPAADNDLFFNELDSVMMANNLNEPMLNVIGSVRLQSLVREYGAQGVANSTNLAFQYGNKSFAYSNRVSIATGNRDTVYAMPVGSLAYLSWVDIDSRLGNTTGDGKEFFTQELPLLGHEVGVLYQSTCGDKSSLLTGLEATKVESFTFSFDYALVAAYNSDSSTLPGSIFKAVFSKT